MVAVLCKGYHHPVKWNCGIKYSVRHAVYMYLSRVEPVSALEEKLGSDPLSNSSKIMKYNETNRIRYSDSRSTGSCLSF